MMIAIFRDGPIAEDSRKDSRWVEEDKTEYIITTKVEAHWLPFDYRLVTRHGSGPEKLGAFYHGRVPHPACFQLIAWDDQGLHVGLALKTITARLRLG